LHFRWQQQALLLHCHIQPNARADEFGGLHGDRLKIRLTAPPVDGKANQQLIRFIANAFGVRRGEVSIIRGDNSRQKDLSIQQPAILPAECLIEAQ
jgi:hypothetical protein